MAQDIYLTRAGFERMSDELERLKTEERRRITKAIAEARSLGDLKENAEYHAAREAQGHCEARIAQLEGILSNAQIIEDLNIPSDKIYIGAIVTLQDLKSGEEIRYMLVSAEEADHDQNRISIFSPIGKGLLGKPAGAEVELEVPAGTMTYKILKIERPR